MTFEDWAMEYYSCGRVEIVPEQARAAWNAGAASVILNTGLREWDGYINGLTRAINLRPRFEYSDEGGRVINDIRAQIADEVERAKTKMQTKSQNIAPSEA